LRCFGACGFVAIVGRGMLRDQRGGVRKEVFLF
jgi:hypothetical protein